MKEKYQMILKNTLLAFILITIGFALGKELTQRRITAATTSVPYSVSTQETTRTNTQKKIIVYYAHTTFRCVSCKTIEALAKKSLETHFAKEMANGTIEWRVINFQNDEAFAEQYKIVSSCVVVVGMRGNTETDYQRLDEVWTKLKDPVEFDNYIYEAVSKTLGEISP